MFDMVLNTPLLMIYGTKYSRMDEVKFGEDGLQKI